MRTPALHCQTLSRLLTSTFLMLAALTVAAGARAQESDSVDDIAGGDAPGEEVGSALESGKYPLREQQNQSAGVSKGSESSASVQHAANNDGSDADAGALAFLRETEARAASGQRIPRAHVVRIHAMTGEGFSLRVRQKALTLLPWFPGDETFRVLRKNLSAPEAPLRVEGMAALLLMYHRLSATNLPAIKEIAETGLWDPNDDVACRSAALLRKLGVAVPDFGSAPVREKLYGISAARYACFEADFSLPPRSSVSSGDNETVEEQASPGTTVATPDGTGETPAGERQSPADKETRFVTGRTGNGMVYAAAAGGGAVIGALLPTLVIPTEERLIYSSMRSRYQRTEASIWVSSAAALGGGALAGAGIWALQNVQGDMTPAQGMGVVLGTWSGGMSGLGVALLTGSQAQVATLSVTGGVLLGLTSSLAAQYIYPPTWQDSLTGAMLASNFAMLGTLTSLAVLPLSTSAVLGATRLDFSLGTGLLVGGVTTALSQWLIPMTRPSYTRLWAAGLVSSLGAASGLWLGSLPGVAGLGADTQWGCVLGAGLQLVSGVIAYYWLPPSWAKWLSPKAIHQVRPDESERAELSRRLFPSLRSQHVGARPVVFLDFIDFRF